MTVAYAFMHSQSNPEEGDFYTITVNERIMEEAGLGRERLHEAALKNMQEKCPEILEKMDSGIYMVSAENTPWGAAAMFYPQVLKSLATRLGANLLVVPLAVDCVFVFDESIS